MPHSHRLVRAVLFASSLSVATGALAARLGPITVVSQAGQPLRAEIELEDGTAATWSRSQVRLGSPDTYRDLGFDYPASLDGATAVLSRLPDGRYRVLVTGTQPIADPRAVPLVVTLRTSSGLHTRSYRLADDGRTGGPVAAAGAAAGAAPGAGATADAPSDATASAGPAAAAAVSAPLAAAPAMPPAGPVAASVGIRVPSAPASAELAVPRDVTPVDEAARAASLAARIERVAASVEPSAPPAPSAPAADTLRLPWPSESVRLPQVAEAPALQPVDRSPSSGTVATTRSVAAPSVADAPAAAERRARAQAARAERGAPRASAAPTAPGAATAGAEGTTVSVVRGDTATSIARRIKPEGVADEQAVMALYRRNEQVFLGSVHRLPAGAVLVLPDPDQVRAIPLAQARADLRAQGPVPGRVAVAAAAAAAAAAPGPVGDRLRLSAGGSGRGKAADASGGAGERERIAHEAAMAEATSRITQLEAVVADLNLLIAMREQHVSNLARAVAEAGGLGAANGTPDGRVLSVGAAAATMIRSDARAVAPVPVAPPEPQPPTMLWSGVVGGLAIAAGGAVWFVRRRRR